MTPGDFVEKFKEPKEYFEEIKKGIKERDMSPRPELENIIKLIECYFDRIKFEQRYQSDSLKLHLDLISWQIGLEKTDWDQIRKDVADLWGLLGEKIKSEVENSSKGREDEEQVKEQKLALEAFCNVALEETEKLIERIRKNREHI